MVKNFKFIHPFFFGQIGLKKVFGAVLDRKQDILNYKTSIWKSGESDIFLKGFAYGFGQKFENFSALLFRPKPWKKVFGNVLDRKQERSYSGCLSRLHGD